MSLLRLFLIFVKIGAILLGGGYVILPIIQYEFTEKRKLISKEDVINYYAISQSLPGIVAANMSIFIGYKLHGKLGAVVSMIGIIFIPFFCIVFLASLLSVLSDNVYLQRIFKSIGIAVIALILLTVREMWQQSKRNMFFYFIFLFSLIALLIFKLSPISVIIIFSLVGIIVKDIQRRKLS